VVKEGQPILGFSCIGWGLRNQTLTSLIDVLDFKMTPDESAKTPSVGANNFFDGTLSLFIEPEKYSDSLISKTKELGGDITVNPSANSGYWTGIYHDVHTGQLYGTEVWQK